MIHANTCLQDIHKIEQRATGYMLLIIDIAVPSDKMYIYWTKENK